MRLVYWLLLTDADFYWLQEQVLALMHMHMCHNALAFDQFDRCSKRTWKIVASIFKAKTCHNMKRQNCVILKAKLRFRMLRRGRGSFLKNVSSWKQREEKWACQLQCAEESRWHDDICLGGKLLRWWDNCEIIICLGGKLLRWWDNRDMMTFV